MILIPIILNIFAATHSLSQAGLDDLIIMRTTQNISKLNSYKGVIVQNGLMEKQEVVAEVYYKKPDYYLSKISKPLSLKGVCVLYKAPVLLYYYPNLNWAICIKNFIVPSLKEVNKIIADSYYKNIKLYFYTFGMAQTILNFPTITIHHRAKKKQIFNQSGKTIIYDKFSFPLAGEIIFKNTRKYSYNYQNILFNTQLSEDLFTVKMSDNTIVSEWDLNSKSISLQEMKKKANFQFSLPDNNSFGLKRDRIVSQDGIIPAFTAYYKKEPYFLILTVVRDYNMLSNSYGIPIQTSKNGRLIITPLISSFSFIHNNTSYTLMGNLPFEEILKISNLIK